MILRVKNVTLPQHSAIISVMCTRAEKSLQNYSDVDNTEEYMNVRLLIKALTLIYCLAFRDNNFIKIRINRSVPIDK